MGFEKLKGVSNAQSYNRSVYFEPGNYPCVEIVKLFVHDGQQGDTFFGVEAKVIESEVPTRPAGTSCSWTVKVPGAYGMGLGNVKGFFEVLESVVKPDAKLMAMLDIKPTQNFTDEDFIERSVKAGTFEGIELGLNCVLTDKKKSEGKFTHHNWGRSTRRG